MKVLLLTWPAKKRRRANNHTTELLWGRDRAGRVVRFLSAMLFLRGDYTPSDFMRRIPANDPRPRGRRLPDVSHYLVHVGYQWTQFEAAGEPKHGPKGRLP